MEQGRAAGVVLAGGRSRRFGSNKALADFDGAPLVLRSVAALKPHVDALGVNGPEGLCERLGLACVADFPSAARGPLAGVVGGLLWARDLGFQRLLTAPCDTPFLPADLGAALLAGLGDGAVAVAQAERAHPLCAAWSVAALDAVAAVAVLEEQPPLEALVRFLGGRFVPVGTEAAFINVNTPEDYAAALARLA